jgi:hypothetical protein
VGWTSWIATSQLADVNDVERLVSTDASHVTGKYDHVIEYVDGVERYYHPACQGELRPAVQSKSA